MITLTSSICVHTYVRRRVVQGARNPLLSLSIHRNINGCFVGKVCKAVQKVSLRKSREHHGGNNNAI